MTEEKKTSTNTPTLRKRLTIPAYNDNELIVLTEKVHIERGYCCGNGCTHCPFSPGHVFGSDVLLPEVIQQLTELYPTLKEQLAKEDTSL